MITFSKGYGLPTGGPALDYGRIGLAALGAYYYADKRPMDRDTFMTIPRLDGLGDEATLPPGVVSAASSGGQLALYGLAAFLGYKLLTGKHGVFGSYRPKRKRSRRARR